MWVFNALTWARVQLSTTLFSRRLVSTELWTSASPSDTELETSPTSGSAPSTPVRVTASPIWRFSAPDRSSVLAFFAAAQTLGAEVLHEPRVWPEYHPGYFGAFVRDPDGNNVEAVCHIPEPD